jgi:hypothetical protein
MYFEYGKKETEYLKSKDKKLAEAIEIIRNTPRWNESVRKYAAL